MPENKVTPTVSQLAGEIAQRIAERCFDEMDITAAEEIHIKQHAEPIISAALSERERETKTLLEDALRELDLLRMKDTGAVYDPTVRVRLRAALSALGESKG